MRRKESSNRSPVGGTTSMSTNRRTASVGNTPRPVAQTLIAALQGIVSSRPPNKKGYGYIAEDRPTPQDHLKPLNLTLCLAAPSARASAVPWIDSQLATRGRGTVACSREGENKHDRDSPTRSQGATCHSPLASHALMQEPKEKESGASWSCPACGRKLFKQARAGEAPQITSSTPSETSGNQ